MTRLLEDVGRATERAVAAEAGRLATWFEPVRTVRAFPAPLFRDHVG